MIISFHSPLNPDQWNGHTSDKRLININALGRLFWMALVARNIKLLYFWAYLKIKPPYIFNSHEPSVVFPAIRHTRSTKRESSRDFRDKGNASLHSSFWDHTASLWRHTISIWCPTTSFRVQTSLWKSSPVAIITDTQCFAQFNH